MRMRPILMNAEMVRAVIEGRKTQTRRPVRAYMFDHIDLSGAVPELRGKYQFLRTKNGGEVGPMTNPFGQPGDRLWVRETWAKAAGSSFARPLERYMDGSSIGAIYKATPHPDYRVDKWRPSIHMPRWASRITLEITDVHVERLHDISVDGARAEGITEYLSEFLGLSCPEKLADIWRNRTSVENYRFLWDSIYWRSIYAWIDNPWVWVVEFRRAQP